jgi:C4-dicarboxylate-specific signal transduction histidine kinase
VKLIEKLPKRRVWMCPSTSLAKLFADLLSNALAALNGTKRARSGCALSPTARRAQRSWLRIEDNGPGVPESIREHLFEPFVSQSSGRERLGLGLFLAASLLDMYDGRIRYEDQGRAAAPALSSSYPRRDLRAASPITGLPEEQTE